MKKLIAILSVLAIFAVSVFAVEPYVRVTLTPSTASADACYPSMAGFNGSTSFGIGGGADILNISEDFIFGADAGLTVKHLQFARGTEKANKERCYDIGLEATPYVKYVTSKVNFGFGPTVAVNFNDTKYKVTDELLVKDSKALDVTLGGKVFAEVPFANGKFAFVPALNYAVPVYASYANRKTNTGNKGSACFHYTNEALAWASFSIKCSL